ncbi:PEP-CTERM sorting domain-containing protein [Rubrivivax sp. RP6-9]|uniref:PEP-CTERM sorting domain-containing protein n=1 Tax=Rubrivivax sp. RP6-9 TaxID=3415750 RepID=UPI003CC5F222
MNRIRLFRPAAACATALALSAPFVAPPSAAAAAAVTYTFAGLVESDDGERGWDRFTGSFRFDTTTPDAIADPSTGAYAHAGAPWGLTLDFFSGASHVHALAIDASFFVLVSNDLGSEDQLGLLAQDAGGTDAVSMTLIDTTGSTFTSHALPLPAGGLTLPMFAIAALRCDGAGGALQGRLDALGCIEGCTAAVPEPGTGTLLLAGLGAATLLQRRRRIACAPTRQDRTPR